MGASTYTGTSLEQAIKSGSLERTGTTLTGMVKESEKAGHIQFARGGCETWLDLPTNLIDEAEHLGQQSCRDHVHPVFKITFKEPKDPTARIFASLLAVPMPASSLGVPMQAPPQAGPFPRQTLSGPSAQMRSGVPPGALVGNAAAGMKPKGRAAAAARSQFYPPWGGLPGYDQPPEWGLPCWEATCCDCVEWRHVDNGTAEWDVCVQWTCYPCEPIWC
jgi:hypothetical protein